MIFNTIFDVLFNTLEKAYWFIISSKKIKLAYQYVHNACQKYCDDNSIPVKYIDYIDPSPDNKNFDKLKDRIMGTYNTIYHEITLLNDYGDSNMHKYQTWCHEIGHHIESKVRKDLIEEINLDIDQAQFVPYRTLNDMIHYKTPQALLFKMGYLHELRDLAEQNADYEGFNAIIRKLPAWVIASLYISFTIIWKNSIHVNFIEKEKEDVSYMTNSLINFQNYLKYFNYSYMNVLKSWKKYKKENRIR